MNAPQYKHICPNCGYESLGSTCSLCAGPWQTWELMFAPIPIEDLRRQVAVWFGQLPEPVVLEIAALPAGIRLRLYAPDGEVSKAVQAAVQAFAAMTSQQMRWRMAEPRLLHEPALGLRSDAHVPVLALSGMDTDPLLAIGSRLMGQVKGEKEISLRLWLLGRDPKLQERLRALSAYSYGTEGGVGNDTPNPWGLRLAFFRGLLFVGMLIAGISAGAWAADWISFFAGLLGVLSGGTAAITASLGVADWMRWRSIPKEVLEMRTQEPLLKVAFTMTGSSAPLELLAGEERWQLLERSWPAVKAFALSLPVADIAVLVSPPQKGEGSGIIDRAVRQDVPTPPPSLPLTSAAFKVGWSAGTGESIGVDPDGHGLATGGSRTGKSSFAYAMLKQLVEKGNEAPGIFLVDPHASLADGFLDAIACLPEEQRARAIKRLRIITPDQPEVVPLNLLCIPDFTWAGNAIVQIGRRIWDDYWGPRMQAALLGLFRLAHAWNSTHPTKRMGLLHVVFAAYNPFWRKEAMEDLPPAERVGTIALNALLGQVGGTGNWTQGWITEVVSPILSKVMALELSPWLFAAMHQDRFVDMESWVKERAWVVLRLPSGTMGREGAKLTAGVVYNVFDAAFRKVTMNQPIPFYFIVDEAQEVGAGMRLESMLAEGAKFGARMFVLVQSLSMMRQMEGLEPVVQALLANTSTQAFFSPDPEDADLIRATLSSTVRYGATTLDLPSLHCWLRARLAGQWQPPTLARVAPLARADAVRVNQLIREVIEAHPKDYVMAEDWQKRGVRALREMLPPAERELLDAALKEKRTRTTTLNAEMQQAYDEKYRRLGLGDYLK